jgi:hypothetical protein
MIYLDNGNGKMLYGTYTFIGTTDLMNYTACNICDARLDKLWGQQQKS